MRAACRTTLTASAGGAARKDEHPLIRPVSGTVCGERRRRLARRCTAEICTLPIDRTKVMMQIATDSKGLVGTMRNVIEKEGAGALFKGAKPALLRQASYQSIKMALYEPIRDAVMRATSDDPNADPYALADDPRRRDRRRRRHLPHVADRPGEGAHAVGRVCTTPSPPPSPTSTRTAASPASGRAGVPNCQRSFIVNAAELATCAARPPARPPAAPAPPPDHRLTRARARRPMLSQVRLLQAAAAESSGCPTGCSARRSPPSAPASSPRRRRRPSTARRRC